MAGRSSTFLKCQLGVEVTPGTAVAANKRPLSFQIRPQPDERVEPFRPGGSAAPTARSQAKAFTPFDIEGALGFTDITYLLGSVLRQPTGSYTYLPSNFTPDAIHTYTIEVGDADRADKLAYGVITGLNFSFDETEVSISGNGFGQRISEGITLTGSPTNIGGVVANPKDTVISIGNSVGGLAALPKGTSAEFGITDRWKPCFYLNADASYTEHRAGTPGLSASLQMNNDSTASDLLADLRSGQIKIVRIRNVGPEYGSGTPYIFQLTFPAFLTGKQPTDDDDAYLADIQLQPAWDPTFGGFMEIVVTNGASGL